MCRCIFCVGVFVYVDVFVCMQVRLCERLYV